MCGPFPFEALSWPARAWSEIGTHIRHHWTVRSNQSEAYRATLGLFGRCRSGCIFGGLERRSSLGVGIDSDSSPLSCVALYSYYFPLYPLTHSFTRHTLSPSPLDLASGATLGSFVGPLPGSRTIRRELRFCYLTVFA